ncbi:MAG: hypothetical protein GX801_06295 [Fibrobacter sp.]|nr:hypothetical protein [Fibrobacter sp.]
MKKKYIVLILLSFLMAYAQADDMADEPSSAEDMYPEVEMTAEERMQQRQFEEEQRLDEYANSMRRRDWLKDRLIFELGLGSKYPVMGKSGFSFGLGVEYITRWHFAPFVTYGLIPESTDPSFEAFKSQGGTGYRVGMTYYLNPKSPMHIGIMASYGDVYYDHRAKPGPHGNNMDLAPDVRELIQCKGWEFDLSISYLTNEWYFLNFIAGIYYIGKDSNPGMEFNNRGVEVSIVTNDAGVEGIPSSGLVFGLGIGFALPELFPDDTEVRRRERAKKRGN